jgi:alpha-D-ribose 1-methylphosphonate 5-triphosphate synthase subunit PhnL
MDPAIDVRGLTKTFVLHSQGGVRLPVFHDLDLVVRPGECVALHGPSGAGKSTLLRGLYANYKADGGSARVLGVDLVTASPRQILRLRKDRIGYVSQFLRVIPRVPTLEIVAEPLRAQGVDEVTAKAEAARLLTRLNIPEAMWSLAPVTFSGGEQQRVNIARGFVLPYPVLLLDEPTASLDAGNREVVLGLIDDAKARGAAIVGIFHDADVRDRAADRLFDMKGFSHAA